MHGRVEGATGRCAVPGCRAPGEYKAPVQPANFDGPGVYTLLCLDHVREHNSKYNFFEGMSPDEIADAQSPIAGWDRSTRAFASAGADPAPSWSDFSDPLDAISARFRHARRCQHVFRQHADRVDDHRPTHRLRLCGRLSGQRRLQRLAACNIWTRDSRARDSTTAVNTPPVENGTARAAAAAGLDGSASDIGMFDARAALTSDATSSRAVPPLIDRNVGAESTGQYASATG